jgi:hypothetical protein
MLNTINSNETPTSQSTNLEESNNFNKEPSESSDIQSEGNVPIMTLPYYGSWKTTEEELSVI